MSPEVVKT